MLIPTKVLDVIQYYIQLDSDFNKTTEKTKQKVIKKSIELWYFIYNRQIQDDKALSLDFYTQIDSKELTYFEIEINGKRYKYNKFLSFLISCKLISVNEKYSVGKFYSSYKVETEFLKGSSFSEIEIDFTKVFKNTRNKSYWLNKYPQYTHLINDAYNCKVDIDNYYDWMVKNEGKELKPVISNGILKQRILDNETIFEYLTSALKVNFNNLWFKLSNEGRFYSSISNLSYTTVEYGFIRLYGKQVVEIDLKNCQPLLLTTLLSNKHKQYKEDVEDGEFYYKVGQEIFPHLNRDDVKKQFKVLSYRFIFFNNKALKTGKIYNAMEKIYPGLIEEINEIKCSIELAKKLQCIESKIFVEVLGSLPIQKLLRHDQILFFPEYSSMVNECLRIELLKLNIKYKF
jgi:hypothetical protein